MTRFRSGAVSAALTLPLLLGATGAIHAGASGAIHAGGPPPATTKDFQRSVLTTGLANPFEILFGPGGRLWVTERSAGRVTAINPSTGTKHTLLKIPRVVSTKGLPDGVVVTENEQDGLLGMALHRSKGNLNVYLSYTYDGDPGPGLARRQRIVRYQYAPASDTLVHPHTLIEGLLASDDHNSGRIQIGRDGKLYYTIGDRGNNQDLNACRRNEAQRLPTRAEVRAKNWVAYQGKTLRMNLDGSIPADNPVIAGVRSHVWTYGHRNAQGLVIAPHGLVYSSEQGPKSDDELNLLRAGGNYGWPRIAGFQDGDYVYGNWSARKGGCNPADYNAFVIPKDVPQFSEFSFHAPNLVPPLRSFFAVPPDYDFRLNTQRCAPLAFICYPTVAPSNLDLYTQRTIPGWHNAFLMTTLKTGTLFVMPRVSPTQVDGPFRLFRSVNRYRDTAVSPDGKTIYVATDSGGLAADLNGLPTDKLDNPGAILAFRFTG
jgi:PQQ-dependent dehydrogenase (s-GDH family)